MSYISIHLYRKVLEYALSEGMSRHDFTELPVPLDAMNEIQAVPSDSYFALHELLDDTLNTNELSQDQLDQNRLQYALKWNRLHILRTVFAVLSFIMMLIPIINQMQQSIQHNQ